jgi:hypothetical protein
VTCSAFLVFAGLTKAEGRVHVAAFAGAIGLASLVAVSGVRARLRALSVVAVPAFILAVHELLVTRRAPLGTLHDDYGTALTLSEFGANLDRFATVIGQFAERMFLRVRHGFVGWWLCLGAYAAWTRRREFGIVHPVAFAIAMYAAFTVPYTVLPIFNASCGRLFSQLLPVVFVGFVFAFSTSPPQEDGAERAS